MATETKIRKQILRRIERIPDEHLAKIDNYLRKLETRSTKRDKILSYAGAKNELDESVFREFTDALIKRRQEKKDEVMKRALIDTDILSCNRKVFKDFSRVIRITPAIRNILDHIDFIIGGIAIENDLFLVTNNVKHFGRIPNLKIENRTQ